MKKYVKPEIEIEVYSPCKDIMNGSMVITEEEDTIKGRIDIESLINRINTISSMVFKK